MSPKKESNRRSKEKEKNEMTWLSKYAGKTEEAKERQAFRRNGEIENEERKKDSRRGSYSYFFEMRQPI